MSKMKSQYVCQNCGAVSSRWAGQCTSCGEWNTITEEIVTTGSRGSKSRIPQMTYTDLSGTSPDEPRVKTGMHEFDRVLGGGIVQGSAVLIGGDPGIGKSTILLQASASLARNGVTCAYVSGEESIRQIQMRAKRLGLDNSRVKLASVNNARMVANDLACPNAPSVMVIDSIQTMCVPELEGAAGTVAQIRASVAEIIQAAKQNDVAVFLVGHVTKEGAIAGPKLVEHAVDCVLYFEGERSHQYRILRSTKNRFGATDEIGVFEMSDRGLAEVANPSQIFLSDRQEDIAGSVVFPGIEGTRPILVEIQALVSPTSYGSPRRTVVGWDSGRLAMILAVLEARLGISFGMHDVYLNVVGGFRITEPAADLAVATALMSSISGTPIPSDTVVFGEIGLGGEVRPVGQTEQRLKEAAKLGFGNAYLPRFVRSGKGAANPIAKSVSVNLISELAPLFADDLRQFSGDEAKRPRAVRSA